MPVKEIVFLLFHASFFVLWDTKLLHNRWSQISEKRWKNEMPSIAACLPEVMTRPFPIQHLAGNDECGECSQVAVVLAISIIHY